MPDHGEFQNNALSSTSHSSPRTLEDAIWRLKVDDNNKEGVDANQDKFPDRPGAPDCMFYLRTGLCGYGSNCRYNHPTYNEQATQDRGEFPERVGQPDCQYFLKTGTCKYGSSCKYHHPQDRYDAQPTPLNILGLPIRQDEKPCPYYMRTGSCKFGVACKFNHPQLATFGAVFPATIPSGYGSSGSLMAPPSNLPLIGGLSTWPLARPYLTSPRMQGLPAYMPVILPSSQGALPIQQGWSSYTLPNTKSHAQSGSGTTPNLPERPDQPECQYYLKTGSCRYGPTCKYHHPKEMYSDSLLTLGPLGLPLRPGHDICTYYSTYGSCRYGAACKYDHPLMGFYNYSLPPLSVPDPSTRYHPNPMNLPQATSPSPTTQTPTIKTGKSPDSLEKSGENADTDNSNDHTEKSGENAGTDNSNDHTDNPPKTPAMSPSTTTAPSSDSPQKHSD